METNLDDIKHIRSMMERSSKFLSLSGMSGVSAGTVALLGALGTHYILKGSFTITGSVVYDLVLLAILVIIGAAVVGFYFCDRKAKKNGSKLWMPVTWQALKDFSVPMVVGGLFCLILLSKSIWCLIAPSMLIFYGLSLIYAGDRTYRDVKMLGVCEIILGLIAAAIDGYNLLIWALGFGVLHILYGIIIHYKYDMKSDKNG
ncbi:hypothetical protein M2451_000197 [Dysgonomonas sp. PFB1-18]|uniref:hypothetical protein n=1 Tax=unclassified Dysgonomonas TaxID=2630389 RepID=UPI00247350C9|nr:MULTISPECIES: hypothetical protein [unclassified Dysgonomonas]MDH6307748.1 hypothetical protein [Dysgonomonas sp. PF1-14]MDH6337666.1 hypothetical protein [Dysgonomonas sp. PF1-16]MDH6378890.1 hypothetical protein [Dysgonomonas sp. PFB1-18]MDH6396525.1 hypothetical protein [Dysgonomonas sp. PF1-23]